jgi:hypothetical protein
MRFLLATAAALLVGTVTVQACEVSELAGDWTTAQTNVPEICTLTFDEDGKIKGICRTYKKSGAIDTSRSASGTIRIDDVTCEVNGTIRVGDRTRSFQGNTAADLTIIIGSVRRQTGFIAYKDID